MFGIMVFILEHFQPYIAVLTLLDCYSVQIFLRFDSELYLLHT
jgi:hypothetical protein